MPEMNMTTLTQVAAAKRLPDWSWQTQPDALTKVYQFADFAGAFTFATHVAALAESHNHHPQITISWGRVALLWTTHDAGGVTELDVTLAQACDDLVEE